MDNDDSLSEFFDDSESCNDIFSILEALESGSDNNNNNNNNSIATAFVASKDGDVSNESFEFQKSAHNNNNSPRKSAFLDSPSSKRQKLMLNAAASKLEVEGEPIRVSHITVERNRRKQMNEHLTVLRSLMPCFYVKRGDQASIIGGVVNYINELQQILQALETKKQRKAYSDVLSPKPSPRPSPLSPRKPPLSPRILSLPVSPRTPQSGSPYKPMLHNLQTGFLNSASLPSPTEVSPCNSSASSINDIVNELVASSKSAVAEVEVKFCGPNLLLKTVSKRISGQVMKIVKALEELEFEILQVNINVVDERMLNSFTIKIGIECQLSAEELAQQIQQTFC
ncbi:hypothetical protein CASFOL_003288 [Castilleja foliolosa]|uniref:BHLH domain-containing protein n=1 Tax=Castilleja foliolosa TaxID=1961234 RepID=A0ABD3EH97_9LAMI